ncbi:hypothetical protein PNOK_0230600 [Pyrrhoderma noxium]|uniref:Uncharacterized protein n=1 Tax=Pyrrhoderma noxium TaxID=2282107 RepID=A0A286US23_9AGAM|nr:hypothetical protein PNOK_0230600 [Pyrrhoderma noxium]
MSRTTMAERNDKDELPRVSIDTFQDWMRIKSNIKIASEATLDAKLAQLGILHQRDIFLAHLNQFNERAFELAKPNLRINGRNYTDYNEGEHEADQFDESLDRRVWSLSDQRLKWDLEIATKRRGIPSDVESLMRDILAQQREHDESHFPDRNIDMEETEEDPEDATEVTQELSELATELQESLAEQLERVERARQVDNEIRNLRT